ncbi:MAG: CAP domain-containing protein, partial [Chloroflexota bacterium]|nr:CAP domain-containing protein [Chloroflexota bacterium]
KFQPELEAFSGRLGGSPLLVTRIGEDETERLDLPDGIELSPDPVAERQLFDLVNQERTQRGVGALEWDERLVPVARSHSQEMFTLKYFSHDSPVAGSPFDRIKGAGIIYSRAGENLAYARSVSVAHRALMDSPGHRENILRPEFTRIGIGVINAGIYGRMVTQLFLTT